MNFSPLKMFVNLLEDRDMPESIFDSKRRLRDMRRNVDRKIILLPGRESFTERVRLVEKKGRFKEKGCWKRKRSL